MVRRLSFLCLILAMTLTVLGCSQGEDYGENFTIPSEDKNQTRFTIKFGRVPSVTVTELLKQNAPLIRRLKDELNVNVTYRFADNYRGIIEGMRQNEYDIAWLGPYSYVLSGCYSDTSAAYRPLVRPVRRDREGNLSAEYRSIIFTNRNSDIETLSDLKGRSFAFVDRRSTSGFLFPMAKMMDAGLDPETDLEYEFLNRHDRVVQAVDNGDYPAGATYDDARMEEFQSRTRAERRLPVIERTKPIPSSPIAVSRQFEQNHPDVVERFVEIMTSLYKTESGKKILRSLKIARYQKAAYEDYKVVRDILQNLPADLSGVKDFCNKEL